MFQDASKIFNDEDVQKLGFSSREEMDFYMQFVFPVEFEMYRDSMEGSPQRKHRYREKKLKKPNLHEFQVNCTENDPSSSCESKKTSSANSKTNPKKELDFKDSEKISNAGTPTKKKTENVENSGKAGNPKKSETADSKKSETADSKKSETADSKKKDSSTDIMKRFGEILVGKKPETRGKDEQKAKVSETPAERIVLDPEINEEEMKSRAKKELKKQKKLRQKEKKFLEKQKSEPQKQIEESKKKKKKKVEEVKTNDEILESDTSTDDETAGNASEHSEDDIDFENGTPAFFQAVLKNTALKLDEKKKISEKKSDTKSRGKIEPLLENIAETAAASNDFTTFTKKGKRIKTSSKLPEDHASEAIQYIYANKVEDAVDSLTLAISLDPNNNSFYLNRSYCFLRLRQYVSAISDAERVLKNSHNNKELAEAKARAGQACFGMQNYEEAEKYFEECLNLAPNNFQVQRELMRLRIEQLMNMGFSERAAIFALEKHSNIFDAVQYLTENQTIDEWKNSSESDFDCIDEVTFCSDSEDLPSNTRLISKILNYKPGTLDERVAVEFQGNTQKTSRNGVEHFEKKIKAVSGAKYMTKPPYYPTTIWVGNLGPKITEKVLRNTFSKYGQIAFIGHRSGDTYAFINFNKAESVIKILAVANLFEIDGVKLRVSQAHASF